MIRKMLKFIFILFYFFGRKQEKEEECIKRSERSDDCGGPIRGATSSLVLALHAASLVNFRWCESVDRSRSYLFWGLHFHLHTTWSRAKKKNAFGWRRKDRNTSESGKLFARHLIWEFSFKIQNKPWDRYHQPVAFQFWSRDQIANLACFGQKFFTDLLGLPKVYNILNTLTARVYSRQLLADGRVRITTAISRLTRNLQFRL